MICIPIVAESNDDAISQIKEANKHADIIELRLDYLTKPNIQLLLGYCEKPVIATNRSKQQGGRYAGIEKDRIKLLKEAVELGVDYVDVEFDSAYVNEFIGEKAKVIVSYHNFEETPANLLEIYDKIKKTGCDIVKVVCHANSIKDNVRVLDLIKKVSTEIIAFCMGEKGILSRLLCLRYGGFLTFGCLNEDASSAVGQIPVNDMMGVYRVKEIYHKTKIVGLIGNPVAHSKSKVVFNKVFDKLEMNYVYVPFLVDDVGDVVEVMLDLDIRGCSVTIPHKQKIMKYLDEIDRNATRVGAVNTIVNKKDKLYGYNTDYTAVKQLLKNKVENKTVMILGAGGAARAVAYAVKDLGANIIILNRTIAHAEQLAEELDGKYGGLNDISNFNFEVLINATSVGMVQNESPIDKKFLNNILVFDVVYTPEKTILLKEAEDNGCNIISGKEMFLLQGVEQFKLWTGKSLDIGLLRDIYGKSSNI